MTNKSVEDYIEFGDAWVYCRQHLGVHNTGWCTVPVGEKLCLCSTKHDQEFAVKKAKLFGFKIYGDKE